MKIAVPTEIHAGETRVALVPESVKKLTKAGMQVAVQSGAGARSYLPDDDFLAAGAILEPDVSALLGGANLIVKVQPPQKDDAGRHEVDLMPSASILLSMLLPTRNLDAVKRLTEKRISALAADCVPRTTRAQSMDVLSSMANIAGYKAVLIAAYELARYFPMFMTAAGTVFPAKVFVIGAGVAGLQAIATARRLGAAVEATDTRPTVKEEIESLGAKFVGVDAGGQAQDAGGYAKQLSAEFYAKQAALIARCCAAADVVITTALIGGVKAPRLITAEMVRAMKPGSVIVDLACEGGGNCELTRAGQTTVSENGVKICGPVNVPASMPIHGSTLYSRNLTTLILEFWKNGAFTLNLEDEIIKGALVTHLGQVLHGPTRDALAGGGGESS